MKRQEFTFAEGAATEIHSIGNGQWTIDNGGIYDLQGRKVAKGQSLKKGLYIVNGRKVVIK